ncbi:MAG: exodeoxyribonuclease VII large subunit [SAR86 cluster bacterium]|nr:exodeoxyribonuclease VII large subunit [SAR86 cluster bacterium]
MENYLDNSQEIISVSEVNKRSRNILEKEFFQTWIEGEISSFTAYSSGHWYFTIKDERSSLSCVMLSYENNKMQFEPKVGDRLILNGKISIYQPTGKYQLNVKHIELAGEGALLRAFEDLKKKLDQEGLFDTSNKQEIPISAFRVAAITSPDGAVLQDIINVLGRRSPMLELILIPTLVQGEKASKNICKAIELASKSSQIDLIILARGGGSIEDLWAFNTESVARSIFLCKIPIISAIGHETDFTIADFVADLRAPTPSAAAEIISQSQSILPDLLEKKKINLSKSLHSILSRKNDLLKNLSKLIRHPGDRLREISQRVDENESKIKKEINSIFIYKNQTTKNLISRLTFASPKESISSKELLVNSGLVRMKGLIEKIIDSHKSKLSNQIATLDAVSPLAVLSRGYSILTTPDGQIIRSKDNTAEGKNIIARLTDGKIKAKVISKESIEDS